jgi:transcriptional regulator with XRE-family HTH domain
MTNPGGDPTNSTKPRTSIQAALRFTLTDTVGNASQFAKRAGVPESTLSEFRNNRRSVNLTTLESLLLALTPEQYVYFLSTLVDGYTILESKLSDQPLDYADDDFRRAFFALISSYCHRCNRQEQLELLSVIYLASSQNPELASDQPE